MAYVKGTNSRRMMLGGDHFVWGMRLLCGIALVVSGYLAVTALRSGQVAGCGGGTFDCGHVLTSRWARVFGLPVSVPAVLLYGGMLGALSFCQSARSLSIRRRAWDAIVVGAVAAGLAAVWFVSLQMIAIGHLCIYCLAAHTCGLALCGAVLWWRPVGVRRTAILSLVSATGVGLMIGAQLLAAPPATYTIEHHSVEKPAVEADAVGSDNGVMAAPGEVMAAPGESEVMAPPVEAGSDEEFEVFEPFGAVISPSDNPPSAESTRNDELLVRHRARIHTASFVPTALVRTIFTLATETGADQANGETAANEETSAAAAPEKKPVERRLVSISGGKTRLDVRQWPLLGKPDAQYVFVEMFDYTCSHCRATHQTIKGAKSRFGDDLAVLALPVPLNRKCNPAANSSGAQHADACEIAEIAVAVWRVDRRKFDHFHDWLFQPSQPRRAFEARQYAARLVGEEALAEELARPYASQYIAKHVELYQRVGGGAVPKLLFPNSSVVGEVRSTESLVNMIQTNLRP